MSQSVGLNTQNRYEILVESEPDLAWLGLFGEVQARTETLANDRLVTRVSGIVMDQAGLVGAIRRLHGLGIVLLSIRQV